MALNNPLTEESEPLFHDASKDTTMFRVVVKANLTRRLAADLLNAIKDTLAYLERTGAGFAELHGKKERQHHHNHPC